MSRTYSNQFPTDYHPPAVLLAALKAGGWEDASWGNDVSPKFTRAWETLWVDHPDPDSRELPRPRFVMEHGDEGLIAGETEDVATACLWAASPRAYHVDCPLPCCQYRPLHAVDSFRHRMACPAYRAWTVEEIKREILRDIQDGAMPSDVKNYAELHDHVDANYYGQGFELVGENPDGEQGMEAICAMLNPACDEVDRWLKEGWHRRVLGLEPLAPEQCLFISEQATEHEYREPGPLPAATIGGE